MKETDTYIYHHDAAHGWLCVPKAEIARLDLLDDISPYSYHDRHNVYLEADRDAPLFVNALKADGHDFAVSEVHDGDYSPIRDLPRYQKGH